MDKREVTDRHTPVDGFNLTTRYISEDWDDTCRVFAVRRFDVSFQLISFEF